MFAIATAFAVIFRGEVPFFRTLSLLIAQIFCVYIPGAAFLRMTGLSFKNEVAARLCAYATGYVMSVLFYASLLMTGMQAHCVIFSIAYGACFSALLFRKRRVTIFEGNILRADYAFLLCCFTCALLIGVAVYWLPNRSAEVMGYRNQEGDLTYWFKNCVAATKGYPLPELSIDGLRLYWHIFSCFEVAFLHFVTGIELYNLCFTFAYIWKTLLLTGGVYVMASFFLKDRNSMRLVMAVTLFTSGLDPQTYVFYQYHLYRCSLAFEEGYALCMYGLVFFLMFFDAKEKSLPAYLLTLLGVAGALGLKASGGTLLLTGIAVRIILSIRKDRQAFFKVGLLLSYVLTYLLVSRLFIIDANALTSATSSHKIVFSPLLTITKPPHYRAVYLWLSARLSKYLACPITAALYLVQSNYAVSIPLLMSMGAMTVCKKWRHFFLYGTRDMIPLTVMTVSGLGIFIFLSHPGFSQGYFIFNVFSIASVLTFMILERFKLQNAKKVITAITVALALLSCCYTLRHVRDVYLISDSAYQKRVDLQSGGQNDISALEMLGLRWIRDNLPEDVVLATNKVFLNNQPMETKFSRTFITSEFSERQVYLEGFSSANLPSEEFVMERLSKLYDYYSGKQDSADVLKREGVTHAVAFKSGLEPPYHVAGELIYENDDMMVFDLGRPDGREEQAG